MKLDDRNLLGVVALMVVAGLVSYYAVSTQISIQVSIARLQEQYNSLNERHERERERQDRIVQALDALYNLVQEHLRESHSAIRNPDIPLTPRRVPRVFKQPWEPDDATPVPEPTPAPEQGDAPKQ